MIIDNTKISEIIEQNYAYASVLYFLGIPFFEHSNKTLQDICLEKGLSIDQVIQKLETLEKDDIEFDSSLSDLPIDLVISYLQHAHHVFIKERLPYVAKLINNLKPIKSNPSLVKDLKLVFPIFMEDFIHHIYEEEDTLFSQILFLNNSVKKFKNQSKLYFAMEEHSMKEYSLEHQLHDDEMEGIRSITNNYSSADMPLHLRVVYSELELFEQELITHAQIENEILFPKAVQLENQIKSKFKEIIQLN